MAEKIKKTRPELLKWRRALATYERYLPTLILKKQQIQMEILKARAERARAREEMERRIQAIDPWVSLFSESLPGPATRLVKVKALDLAERNVAGIVLPILERVQFQITPYSLFATPPWVDAAIEFVKGLVELRETSRVLLDQERILQKELRKVTQRVNLFEKVMIPRTKENIRVIKIQLGEEEVAAVGRAKIAKGKAVGKAASPQEVRA